MTIFSNGLLPTARYLASPHCDERPIGTVIDMVVIHGISLPPGEYGSEAIEKFFINQLDFTEHPYFDTLKTICVSAHLLIKRTGEVVQFVPFTKRAWHAGQSYFQGQTHCNDFSIGIELEGTDTEPYTESQYQQLVDVLRLLMRAYPAIQRERIVGHCDIAPGRKTDPGPSFEWAKVDCLLKP